MTDEQFKILIKTIRQGMDKIAIATLAAGMIKNDEEGAWQVSKSLTATCVDEAERLLK